MTAPTLTLPPGTPDSTYAARMLELCQHLQLVICQGLEALDGEARFGRDAWQRPGGGGGEARVVENGPVFEKGGVNVSAVHGLLPERMAHAFGVDAKPFFATGISSVIHPRNPHVPTVHFNFRYFALGDDLGAPEDQWFGGGADLTPYFPEHDDVVHFHRVWERVCDRHAAVADYNDFKAKCDRYFHLPHRNEARGVGGIFFDYLRNEPEATFAFVRDAGHAVLDAYAPIVERTRDRPFTDREQTFQEIRRGRYAEFNLAYDRGTRFGLETNGRTESILMSLPPRAQWLYAWQPEPGSVEAEASAFFQPRDWLGEAGTGSSAVRQEI
ncbi:MAG: oxygen-dependent coproporphyrinogen oxidase [Bacteroidota bacterium]